SLEPTLTIINFSVIHFVQIMLESITSNREYVNSPRNSCFVPPLNPNSQSPNRIFAKIAVMETLRQRFCSTIES
ncbi:hypothetical protein VIGAN_04013500, partial [Vigna angularis var. angularis]